MPDKPFVITADLHYLQFTFQDIQRDVSSSLTPNSIMFPDPPIDQAQQFIEVRDIDQVLSVAARVITQDLDGQSIGCVDTATYYALLNVLPHSTNIKFLRPSSTRIQEMDLGNALQLGHAVVHQLAKESLLASDEDEVVEVSDTE